MSENADKVEKAKDRIALEMENEEQYKSFFSQYRTDSVKGFIASYASQKARMEVYGNTGYNNEQYYSEGWQQCAWKCLEEIQHKKLFDLSCQWHAEEIKGLLEVETSYDFDVIGNRILDYQGIPPVSDEDLHFYMQYLSENNYVLGYYAHKEDYQNFEYLKEQFDKHQKTGISYYDYHNSYTGNDRLLKLKAIRKDKEHAYVQLAVNKRGKNKPKPVPKKTKPHLFYFDDDCLKFAKKFNDHRMLAFMESIIDFTNNQQDNDKQWAVSYLRSFNSDTIPISTNKNWLDALCESAIGHNQERVMELLPTIYEEYLIKKSIGIPITAKDKLYHDSFDFIRNLILEGRKYKGEPNDFDF